MDLPSQDTTTGMTNLFLNPIGGEEWDIVFTETGQIVTISGDDYVGQKTKQLLSTAMGEVSSDINYGVPYFEEILGVKNPNLNAISNIFTETILENKTLIAMGVSECSIDSVTLTNERELIVDNLIVATENYIVRIESLGV